MEGNEELIKKRQQSQAALAARVNRLSAKHGTALARGRIQVWYGTTQASVEVNCREESFRQILPRVVREFAWGYSPKMVLCTLGTAERVTEVLPWAVWRGLLSGLWIRNRGRGWVGGSEATKIFVCLSSASVFRPL